MKKKQFATKRVLAVITAASMAASPTAAYAAEMESQLEQDILGTAETQTEQAEMLETMVATEVPVEGETLEEFSTEFTTGGATDSDTGNLNQENILTDGSSSVEENSFVEQSPTEGQMSSDAEALSEEVADEEVFISDGIQAEEEQKPLADAIQDGWVQEGDNWCYYQNGEKLTDQEIYDYDEETGTEIIYRVDKNGNRMSSSWYVSEYGDTYYYKEDGKRAAGFTEIDGNRYYFEVNSGYMYKDTVTSIYDEETGKSYYYKFNTDGTVYTGWYKDGEYEWSTVYYYHEDGRSAEGITEIDGDTYYFTDGGWIYKNYIHIDDGRFYYFGSDGKITVNQDITSDKWIEAGGSWYYVKNQELVKEQFLTLGKYTYYFLYEGRMAVDGELSIYDSETERRYDYRFDADGHMVTGWYKEGENEWADIYYYHENGRKAEGLTEVAGKTYYFSDAMYKNAMVEMDGTAYYFGADGAMERKKDLSEDGWLQAGGFWYYVKDGALVKSQFLKIGNYTYYFEYDGRMLADGSWAIYDEETDSRDVYRFDADGHMVTGWYKDGEEEWSSIYYYHEDGRQAEGLTEIAGKKYYFGDDMYKNIMVELDGKVYYFGEDGILESEKDLSENGWFYAGDNWYYVKDGALAKNQFIKIGNNTYYFEYDGCMVADIEYSIYDSETDQWYEYCFDAEGHMITGWYKDGEDEWSYTYYYHENGRKAEGLTEIDGKTYYFGDYNNAMSKNSMVEIDGTAYYFGKSGVLENKKDLSENGWFYADGDWYYGKDGVLVKEQFLKIGKNTYYFNYDGRMFADGEYSIYDSETDKWYEYCFAADGHMLTGWYRDGEEEWSSVYYYHENGRKAEGLTEIGGKTYYFNNNMYKNSMVEIDGTAYYFGEDGVLESKKDLSENGWFQAGGSWYYAKDESLVCDEILKIGNNTYYFDYEGRMYADGEYSIYDSETEEWYDYRFAADGHMVTGWYKDGEYEWPNIYYYHENGRKAEGLTEIAGKTYYFGDYNNSMSRNCMEDVDGVAYYFGSEGFVEKKFDLSKTGWLYAGENWYYAKSGKLLRNSWITSGNYKYYVDELGIMLSDTVMYIEGYNYRFNKDGHMVTGWYKDGVDWYYYNNNGQAAEGVYNVNGVTYYFNSYGRMFTDCSVTSDGILYYFGENGKAEKQVSLKTDGWKQMPDGWYYAKNGELLRNEWIVSGSKRYYLHYNGKMAVNEVVEISDGDSYYTYRFDENGWMVTGWYQEANDSWYYYDRDGRALSGIQTVGGSKYYFNSNGLMMTSASAIFDGILYYFGENGKEEKQMSLETDGWKQMPDGWYYSENGDVLHNELLELNGYTYYIDQNGKMAVDEEVPFTWNDGSIYWRRFDNNGYMVKGWYRDSEMDWFYYDQAGHGVKGLREINGLKYYFNSHGRMFTDCSVEIDGILYYFGKNGIAEKQINLQTDGWKLTPNGWYYVKNGAILYDELITVNGYTYYLEYDGRMATDVTYTYEENGNRITYRFDSDGHMVKGWYQLYGTWYYYDTNGHAVKGVVEINGAKYYFDEYGQMKVYTALEEDGMLYYFGESGKLEKAESLKADGWKQMPNGRYYAKSGKIVRNQWINRDNFYYYFDADGIMYADRKVSITENGKGKVYRFNKNGQMVTGWFQESFGGWYYYGKDGSAPEGMITIAGKMYYFSNEWAPMSINCHVYYNGKVYIADGSGVCTSVSDGWKGSGYYIENGKAVTGWKVIANKWYYFNPESGRKYSNGVEMIGNKKYYFDSDGAMRTGWIMSTEGTWMFADTSGALMGEAWAEISGKRYYFNEKHEYVTGIYKINGKYHLFDKNGIWQKEIGYQKNGWMTVGTDWYYFQNGQMMVDTAKMIGGKRYKFGFDGRMLKNVFEEKFYYGSDGAAVTNTWKKAGVSGWSYYDENGQEVSSGWKKINNAWYYFVDGKIIQTDSVIDGKLYRFSSSGVSDGVGAALVNGWNLIDGQHYYYYNNDILKNQWITIGKEKYYFDNEGQMAFLQFRFDGANRHYLNKSGQISKGWFWVRDQKYYADSDGVVVTGLRTISGKQYYFEDSGSLCMTDTLSQDKKTIYEIKNGVLVNHVKASGTGWKKSVNGKWFYSKNGIFVTGHQIINGHQYCFDQITGEMRTNSLTYNGYAGADGVLKFNGWYDGSYIVDGSILYRAQTIEGKYYYFEDSISAKGLYYADGAYYFYDGKGGRNKVTLKDGWNWVEGNWYYVSEGKLERTEREINGVLYHFHYSDGRMETNAFVDDVYKGEYRKAYVDANGHMVTGWKLIEGDWYYFDTNGHAVTGTHKINGVTYIFDNGGIMQN